MSFAIVTDSSCNLPNSVIDQYDLQIVSLEFLVEGKPYHSYVKGEDNDLKRFYTMMRNKDNITTSAATAQAWIDVIEPLLKDGQDVLTLAFSSALSITAQEAAKACQTLQQQYPERKVLCVDSLCASLGEGLLVTYACLSREAGNDITTTWEWLEDNKLRLCHWFTVDDLFFLKRGGRVSAATAVLGTMLGIKPVMHVDNQGRLINVAKARGRKGSLDALVDRMAQSAINPEKQTIYISHGDCEEDAQYVAQQCRERLHVKDVLIHYIDPVIGAHSGPGTVALFFFGEQR
ncbi:MAG: DegV family protein [Candidatus Spyradocola sp.]